jgi:hypothetical protein
MTIDWVGHGGKLSISKLVPNVSSMVKRNTQKPP